MCCVFLYHRYSHYYFTYLQKHQPPTTSTFLLPPFPISITQLSTFQLLSHTFCSIYSTRGQHIGITTFSMQIRVSRPILLLTMFQSAKAFIGPTLRHPSRRATRSAGAAAVHASNGKIHLTPFRSISQTNHLFVKPTLSPSFRQNVNIATRYTCQHLQK